MKVFFDLPILIEETSDRDHPRDIGELRAQRTRYPEDSRARAWWYGIGIRAPIPGRILPESEWRGRRSSDFRRLVHSTGRRSLGGPRGSSLSWAAAMAGSPCSVSGTAEFDHLAIDVLPVFIRYATRRADQRGCTTSGSPSRMPRRSSPYVVESSVAEVRLYHPQPYPDRRHGHRRLVTPQFLADVHRGLRPGGLFVVQTDNPGTGRTSPRSSPSSSTSGAPEPWPDAPEGRLEARDPRGPGPPHLRGTGARRDDITRKASLALAQVLPAPNFRGRGPGATSIATIDREDDSGRGR